MPPDFTRKTVSVMDAAEMIGVSRRTLYNWMDEKKIEYVRTAGGSRRIYVDSLLHDETEEEKAKRSKRFSGRTL